jgi:hypothetical protein
MTDEESRLNNIIKAQQDALLHWREQADQDYMRLQRLYWALSYARDYVFDTSGPNELQQAIDSALSGVRVFPPKVWG